MTCMDNPPAQPLTFLTQSYGSVSQNARLMSMRWYQKAAAVQRWTRLGSSYVTRRKDRSPSSTCARRVGFLFIML